MVETWIILALLYPLFLALSNVIDKFLLEKRVKYCFALAPMSGLMVFLLASGVLLFMPLHTTPTQSIVAFSIGIVISITWILYFYILSFEEVSRAMAIGYMTPVIVAVFARTILGEALPLSKYAAILLATTGAILIGIEKWDRGIVMRKMFYLILLNCTLWAVIATLQKYLLSTVSFYNLFVLQSFGLTTGLALTLISQKVRKHVPHIFKSIHFVFVSEALTFTGGIVSLAAMSRTEVSKVSAMGSVQPLYILAVMLLLSTFMPKILKEVFTKQTLAIKIISVVMIVVGTYFIAL